MGLIDSILLHIITRYRLPPSCFSTYSCCVSSFLVSFLQPRDKTITPPVAIAIASSLVTKPALQVNMYPK